MVLKISEISNCRHDQNQPTSYFRHVKAINLAVMPLRKWVFPILYPNSGHLNIHLPSYIDHTLLKPTASTAEIKKLCLEAIEHGFYGVCVNGSNTLFARYLLRGSPVKLVTVVGFPLGAMSTDAKSYEAEDAISNGADEIDMVMHLGALKNGDDTYVVHDIARVKKAIGQRILKVIIEASSLDATEIRKACYLVMEAGADYVKTATGFGGGGATLEDVKLMKQVVGDRIKIKASGGIKSPDMALAYISAGASRIGTSSGIALITPPVTDDQ